MVEIMVLILMLTFFLKKNGPGRWLGRAGKGNYTVDANTHNTVWTGTQWI